MAASANDIRQRISWPSRAERHTEQGGLSAFQCSRILKELRRFLKCEQDMRQIAFFLCQLLHGPMFRFECWVALHDTCRKEIAWAFSPKAVCARKVERTLKKGVVPPCGMKAMESRTGCISLTDICRQFCPISSFLRGNRGGWCFLFVPVTTTTAYFPFPPGIGRTR